MNFTCALVCKSTQFGFPIMTDPVWTRKFPPSYWRPKRYLLNLLKDWAHVNGKHLLKITVNPNYSAAFVRKSSVRTLIIFCCYFLLHHSLWKGKAQRLNNDFSNNNIKVLPQLELPIDQTKFFMEKLFALRRFIIIFIDCSKSCRRVTAVSGCFILNKFICVRE